MNLSLKCLLLVSSGIVGTLLVCGQSGAGLSQRPEIGKPLVTKEIREVQGFRDSIVSLQGHRQKGLILDFWSQGCLTCVQSFPKVNSLYNKYKEKVDFLLVGLENKTIEKIYSKYKNKQGLNMPYAFDSAVFKNLLIQRVPTYVYIDTAGLVAGIGCPIGLDAENIEAFIRHKPINIPMLFDDETEFDYRKPLQVSGNGGPDSVFLFRSLLTGFNSLVPPIGPPCINKVYCRNQIMVGNIDLRSLYDLAYGDTIFHVPNLYEKNSYGTYWIQPVLELEDSSLFSSDGAKRKNLFCYNTRIPENKATTRLLQTIMQRDLSNYFGYSVTIENREMPCWNLVANDLARKNLVTKGGKQVIPDIEESAGFTMTNYLVKGLINLIWDYHYNEPPILDKTEILGNIDLTLDCIMTDWSDLKNALNRQGLDLVPGKAVMKVIVIRDSLSGSVSEN